MQQTKPKASSRREMKYVFSLWFSLIFSHMVLLNLFIPVSILLRSIYPTNNAQEFQQNTWNRANVAASLLNAKLIYDYTNSSTSRTSDFLRKRHWKSGIWECRKANRFLLVHLPYLLCLTPSSRSWQVKHSISFQSSGGWLKPETHKYRVFCKKIVLMATNALQTTIII